MPFDDTGALANPFIVGINCIFQIKIGQKFFRDVTNLSQVIAAYRAIITESLLQLIVLIFH